MYGQDCDFCGCYFMSSNPKARYCPRCAWARKVLHALRELVSVPVSNAWFLLRHPSWRKA